MQQALVAMDFVVLEKARGMPPLAANSLPNR